MSQQEGRPDIPGQGHEDDERQIQDPGQEPDTQADDIEAPDTEDPMDKIGSRRDAFAT
jgi:hypothetical protein